MTKHVCFPHLMYKIILLVVILLSHAVSGAQTEGPSAERAQFVYTMKIHLYYLRECEESLPRFTAAWSKVKRSYEDFLAKEEAEQKALADYHRALAEWHDAMRAYGEAEEKYKRLYEKCERSKRVNEGQDWTKLPDCVEAAIFHRDVVEPAGKTSAARHKDEEYEFDRWHAHGEKTREAMDEYTYELRHSSSIYIPSLDPKGRSDLPSPDQFRNKLDQACNNVRAAAKEDVKRAAEITGLLVQDCRFGEADQFVRSLPDPLGYDVKSELEKHVAAAKEREDDAATKYRQANDLYRKGQVEERAGKLAQAGDLYRNAIARLQEGRTMTKCPGKPELFDKAIEKTNLALNRLAGRAGAPPKPEATAPPKPQAGACAVPQDCATQKRALRARIKTGNIFRKDGGGQWNPAIVKRASDSVGSEELPATPLELNAMNNLIGGYEGCYAKYWAFHEGELPQLTRARDDAYQRKDPATGQRLNEEIGKRRADVGRTHNDCIYRNDETWKTAIRRAKEACK